MEKTGAGARLAFANARAAGASCSRSAVRKRSRASFERSGAAGCVSFATSIASSRRSASSTARASGSSRSRASKRARSAGRSSSSSQARIRRWSSERSTLVVLAFSTSRQFEDPSCFDILFDFAQNVIELAACDIALHLLIPHVIRPFIQPRRQLGALTVTRTDRGVVALMRKTKQPDPFESGCSNSICHSA